MKINQSQLLLLAGALCLSMFSCSPTSPKAATGPDAPTDVTATAGEECAILTWSAVAGAASYNIYYKADSTVTVAGSRVAGVTSPCTLGSLTPRTKYAFIVTALNASGESAPSTIATATPRNIPPGTLSMTPGDGQMKISWTNDPTAASYTVYWIQGNNISKSSPNKVGRVTIPYTVTGLTNMQPYSFGITSTKNGVESEFIDTGSGTPCGMNCGADYVNMTLGLSVAPVFAGNSLTITGNVDASSEPVIVYTIQAFTAAGTNGVSVSAVAVSGKNKIDFQSDAAAHVTTTAAACNGTYLLTVTASAGSATRSIADTFTVTGGVNCSDIFTVLIPVTGSSYTVGDTIHITWNEPSTTVKVNVWISINDGVDYSSAMTNASIPAGVKHFAYKIPATLLAATSTQCKIKVSEYVDDTKYAESGVFTIVKP
jgi:hypothetical protein